MLDGLQDSFQPLEGLADCGVLGRIRQERLKRPDGLQAAIVQSQPRQIEGETVALRVCRIIKNPLGKCPNRGDSGRTHWQPLLMGGLALPASQPGAGIVNVLAKTAPQVARQASELATYPCLAEHCAQLVVPLLEQILADVTEKVEMTSQDRNFELEVLHKSVGCFGHRPA